jgi:hypothetical protein
MSSPGEFTVDGKKRTQDLRLFNILRVILTTFEACHVSSSFPKRVPLGPSVGRPFRPPSYSRVVRGVLGVLQSRSLQVGGVSRRSAVPSVRGILPVAMRRPFSLHVGICCTPQNRSSRTPLNRVRSGSISTAIRTQRRSTGSTPPSRRRRRPRASFRFTRRGSTYSTATLWTGRVGTARAAAASPIQAQQTTRLSFLRSSERSRRLAASTRPRFGHRAFPPALTSVDTSHARPATCFPPSQSLPGLQAST